MGLSPPEAPISDLELLLGGTTDVQHNPPTTLTGTYAVDAVHSRIGFVVRQATVTKVRGSFNEFAGTGYFDAEDPTRSQLELTIQAQSIDTANARRDAHLRSSS